MTASSQTGTSPADDPPASTSDPDFRLAVGDATIRPETDGVRFAFFVPEGVREAWLLSRTSVPSRSQPGSSDARRLGLPVARVCADGFTVPLDDPALRQGWYGSEAGRWRWTDGAARLAFAAPVRTVALQLDPGCVGGYLVDEATVEAVPVLIDFGVAGNSGEFMLSGWSRTEGAYTWTIGEESKLAVEASLPAASYLLVITATPSVHPAFFPAQRVSVVVNEAVVGGFELRERGRLECALPPGLIRPNRTTTISLRLPDATRPRDHFAEGDDRRISLAVENIRLLRLRAPAPAPAPALPADRSAPLAAGLAEPTVPEKLQRFENLGWDCEFALVQKHFGVGNTTLFSFATTPHYMLINALEAGLEGLGEPENTDLVLQLGEYFVHDKRYGFKNHTWIRENQVEQRRLRELQCRRTQFLKQRFLDTLMGASRILVFKRQNPTPEQEIRRLHRALRDFGPNTLLWVDVGDPVHPAGTVEQVEDGLLMGYIDRLAPVENASANISFSGWATLCAAAWRLWTAPDPAVPAPDAQPEPVAHWQ
ncbi:MAG: hypothetical protein JO209_08340 [Acidisphaera sp.]|nr:hypothetical protein [Acidisphaera sp.]